MENTTNAALSAQVASLQAALNNERRLRISKEVKNLIDEGRVHASACETWINRALADETVLNDLRSSPISLPGHEGVSFTTLDVVNADVRNVFGAMQQHIVTGPKAVENATSRSAAIRTIYTKERERVLQVMNATVNTVSADLKRVVILNETVRAFSRRLLAMRMFSTVFENVPLLGTDEVAVPYFPLQAIASKDFDPAEGYVFNSASNSLAKKLKVDRRKYQTLDYSSEEFRRQPYFNSSRLGTMNAEKLATDVLLDILSIITAEKFGAAVKDLEPAAWNSDDVEDVRRVCNDANWPEGGRGLIVNTDLDSALCKDPSYKLALNVGGTEVIRDGRLPNISGFEYAYMPGFPDNGEKLIGIATFVSAILAAFSPVAPAPGVRAQLFAYEVVTDAQTGISMNYRHWGGAQADRDYEVIETAYGFEAGEEAALKRFTKP